MYSIRRAAVSSVPLDAIPDQIICRPERMDNVPKIQIAGESNQKMCNVDGETVMSSTSVIFYAHRIDIYCLCQWDSGVQGKVPAAHPEDIHISTVGILHCLKDLQRIVIDHRIDWFIHFSVSVR